MRYTKPQIESLFMGAFYLALLLRRQASHKEKLTKALETERPEEEEVKEEPDDHSSEEDGGIGFKRPDDEAKMKRRRTKGPEVEPASSRPSGKRKQPTQASASSALPDQLKAAQSSLSTLQAFTPQALWQGSLKVKEVDKRLAASLEVHAALEEYVHTSPEAEQIAQKLSQVAQRVTDWMECLLPFKDSDGCLMNAKVMDADDVSKLNKHLPADCIHSVVMEVGKRFLEAGSGFQCVSASQRHRSISA